MVNQPRRYDTESHGAGPSNLDAPDSTITSLIRRDDQHSFQWSRVPYSLFTSDKHNDTNNTNNEEQLLLPPPRSGAASVVVNGKLYVFGGFGGGTGRLDDFYVFDFSTLTWDEVEIIGDEKPGCRENNGACVISDGSSSKSHNKIIVFGGYNGNTWLSDLWSYDITSRRWTCIQESSASSSSSNDTDNVNDETTATSDVINTSTMAAEGPSAGNGRVQDDGVTARNNNRTNLSRKRPCCRFGYVSLVHDNKFILWGGFDGTKWMNDMWIFDFGSDKWNEIQQLGTPPSRRSCPAWAKDEKFIYIHGGFDGIERKDDFFACSLDTYTWTQMPNRGILRPSPRYFHSCVLYDNKLIFYGGYSGSQRLSDMHTYDLQSNHWSKVIFSNDDAPSGRSSLVAQVYKNYLYIFSGYNGTSVMNDMHKCRLQPIYIPPPSLVQDFRLLINDSNTSDVCFLVEGKKVHAHKSILAVRSEYFQTMLFNGHMRESSDDNNQPVEIPDISHRTFLKVLEFLYTDTLSNVSPELGIQVLIASELLMLDRLKAICEDIIRNEINLDNAISILLASHQHNALGLKDTAFGFILRNLSNDTIQIGLNDLKIEPDLLVDIIKLTSLKSVSATTQGGGHPSPHQQYRNNPNSQQEFHDFQSQWEQRRFDRP